MLAALTVPLSTYAEPKGSRLCNFGISEASLQLYLQLTVQITSAF